MPTHASWVPEKRFLWWSPLKQPLSLHSPLVLDPSMMDKSGRRLCLPDQNCEAPRAVSLRIPPCWSRLQTVGEMFSVPACLHSIRTGGRLHPPERQAGIGELAGQGSEVPAGLGIRGGSASVGARRGRHRPVAVG